MKPRKCFLVLLNACFLLAMAFAACKNDPDPCAKELMVKDARLDSKMDSVHFHKDEMGPEVYRASVEKLREEELQLFKEVRECSFGKNEAASNYWYRGRLKFPSRIQQELERLGRENVRGR